MEDPSYAVPLEMYPEAKLASFELKGSSVEVKQEAEDLQVLKKIYDAIRIELRTNERLGFPFDVVFACKASPKHLTTDAAKKILQEIENALVHCLLFTVRQRRFVTKLKHKGLRIAQWRGKTRPPNWTWRQILFLFGTQIAWYHSRWLS